MLQPALACADVTIAAHGVHEIVHLRILCELAVLQHAFSNWWLGPDSVIPASEIADHSIPSGAGQTEGYNRHTVAPVSGLIRSGASPWSSLDFRLQRYEDLKHASFLPYKVQGLVVKTSPRTPVESLQSLSNTRMKIGKPKTHDHRAGVPCSVLLFCLLVVFCVHAVLRAVGAHVPFLGSSTTEA